jgi:hypothetical protein
MNYITAHEIVKPIFWIVLLSIPGAICIIFTTIQLGIIAGVGRIFKRKPSVKYDSIRTDEKALWTFGILSFCFLTAIGYLVWTEHTSHTVSVSEKLTTTTRVDEAQMRNWRSDEKGVDLVYSYTDSSGVPVFKDFSDPSHEVFRKCSLIFTDTKRQEGLIRFDREVQMKVTPQCSNVTTDGSLVPIKTATTAPAVKPTPSKGATKPTPTPSTTPSKRSTPSVSYTR